jgi:hypothetical protein
MYYYLGKACTDRIIPENVPSPRKRSHNAQKVTRDDDTIKVDETHVV